MEWGSPGVSTHTPCPAKQDGKTRTEVVYGITGLSPTQATAHRLLELIRQHWAIENRLHWRRDVTLREDHCPGSQRNRSAHARRAQQFLARCFGFLRSLQCPQADALV
ncbi:MAG: transposase [Chloroflexi bacterium]|nr:transposase [Chloroflexota bacterium]